MARISIPIGRLFNLTHRKADTMYNYQRELSFRPHQRDYFFNLMEEEKEYYGKLPEEFPSPSGDYFLTYG